MSIVSLGGKIAPALLVPDQNTYIQVPPNAGQIQLTAHAPKARASEAPFELLSTGSYLYLSRTGWSQQNLPQPEEYEIGDLLVAYQTNQGLVFDPVGGGWAKRSMIGVGAMWWRVADGTSSDNFTVPAQAGDTSTFIGQMAAFSMPTSNVSGTSQTCRNLAQPANVAGLPFNGTINSEPPVAAQCLHICMGWKGWNFPDTIQNSTLGSPGQGTIIGKGKNDLDLPNRYLLSGWFYLNDSSDTTTPGSGSWSVIGDDVLGFPLSRAERIIAI